MSIIPRISLIAGLLLAAPSAFAHDPAQHAAQASAAQLGPDCAALAGMKMPTMDMNDPVMKAMHMKCMRVGAPVTDKVAPMGHGTMQGMDHSRHGD